MINRIRLIVPAVLASLLLSTLAAATSLKPLHDWMESLVDSGTVVGCMVQVTKDGDTIFLEAVGKRTPESDDELETKQVMRIYSMSKAITSAAVMQLIEQKKLGIDDPVSMYIPEFADVQVSVEGELQPARRPVTIRDLLTHTSGLAYDFSAPEDLVPEYRNKLSNVNSLEEAAVVMSRMPLAVHPGSSFVYGLNTDVLGRVVEVVADTEFETYLRDNIFTPLQMNDTGFMPDESIDLMHIVTERDGELVVDQNHYKGGSKILKPDFQSGGGGLWSTIGDYSRFCMAMEQYGTLDGQRILRPETVIFMTQNHLAPGTQGRDGQRFGLGFGMQPPVRTSAGPRGGGRWTWGGAACTYFFIDPRQNVTAVFATQKFPFDGAMGEAFHQTVLEALAKTE